MLLHVSVLAPDSPQLLRQCKQPLKQLSPLWLLAAPCTAKRSPLPHSSAEQTGLCGNLIWGWEGMLQGVGCFMGAHCCCLTV